MQKKTLFQSSFGKSQINRYTGSASLIAQLVKGAVLYNQTELDRPFIPTDYNSAVGMEVEAE
jgi:hypothetical protein